MSGAFTVPVEGAELHGEQRDGAGTPLVLVHGMAGDRHDWDAVIAALAPDRPFIRYDLRGFGASVAAEGVPFSHADDLAALLRARGIAEADVVGVSMGGAVALNFALNYPDHTRRLVLISPAIVGWEWSDEWRMLWRGVARAARDGNLALARERWWRHPMFAVARDGPPGEALRRSIERYHGRQWTADDQRPELSDVERLHQLRAPTLLLTGERDVADMRLTADVIAASAPDLRRIDMAEAGHVLHLERPAAVAAAIAEFVG